MDGLIGKRFGKLTVLSSLGRDKGRNLIFECLCDCGKKTKTRGSNLTSGHTQSCGCLSSRDITGVRFGKLIAKKRVAQKSNGEFVWKCLCDCGNTTKLPLGSLTRKVGATMSCGCINNAKQHGLSGHPLYKIFYSMMSRCLLKNTPYYGRYGGRGISVCKEWANDFEHFYEFAIKKGWVKGLQIDRIDNDGDYCPGNCRFVTVVKNAENTRRSRFWVINGVEYKSARKASIGEGVCLDTIQTWCGRRKNWKGEKENKEGCYAYLKYGGEAC